MLGLRILPLVLAWAARAIRLDETNYAALSIDSQPTLKREPSLDEMKKKLLKKSKSGTPGAESGDCAVHDVDNYRPSDGEKCYIYMYMCSDTEESSTVKDHNAGDIAWGLTHTGKASSCFHYGKYLHIFKVEVALASMYQAASKKHQYYSQCNFFTCEALAKRLGNPVKHCEGGMPLCGCGLQGNKCGNPPDRKTRTANNFGWRTRSFEFGLTYQFALPRRAMGEINASRAYDFASRRAWAPAEGDASEDAPYQWRPTPGAEKSRVVDIEKCFGNHVWRENQTVQEAIDAFRQRVLVAKPKGDCKGANSGRRWFEAGMPQES